MAQHLEHGTSTHDRAVGTLPGGLPFLRAGTGRPLVVVPGLLPDHDVRLGTGRRLDLTYVKPFASHREVWLVGRHTPLPPRTTMAAIAASYATALRTAFDGPVDVLGHSTGGSIALQLAADAPDVVRRLVVVSAAYRLGDEAARASLRTAELIADGRRRAAGAELMGLLGGRRTTKLLLRGAGWLAGERMFPGEQPDLRATVAAEDLFDLRDRLGEITAPTLVIGGSRDAYPARMFRDTAAGIPGGRVLVYPGRSHLTTTLGSAYPRDVLAFLDAA